MYDGKQVARVDKFKKTDLYNIWQEQKVELEKERKGTGNYELERSKFNVQYVDCSERNLYQEVKTKLKDRNIEYSKRSDVNWVNGIILTSGIEFYEHLGMKLKDSGRIYQAGDKKGQPILVPDIKSKDDIPKEVTRFFDSCLEFLKEEVGEENIVMAQVHYDEDTPHFQAYFMPIVEAVDRKCYVKDDKGKNIKEKLITKEGKETIVPKLLRDDDGNIVYEKVKGLFLNNDQFWKDRGAQNSFSKLQDRFNDFATAKGYNLDRGNKGTNIEHKTKLEYDIENLKAEAIEMNNEIDNTKKLLDIEKEATNKIKDIPTNDIYSPTKRKFGGYKEDDVDKIIDFAKAMETENIIKDKSLNEKEHLLTRKNAEMETLDYEISRLKSGEALIDKDKIIENQRIIIKEKDLKIKEQKTLIESLQQKVIYFSEKAVEWMERFKKMGKALAKKMGIYKEMSLDDYNDLADDVLSKNKYSEKHIEDDFDLGR